MHKPLEHLVHSALVANADRITRVSGTYGVVMDLLAYDHELESLYVEAEEQGCSEEFLDEISLIVIELGAKW